MRFAKTESFIAGLLFALIPFTFAQNNPQNKRSSSAAMAPGEQSAATELFNDANEDRSPEGLQSLKRDPALTEAAWQHAQRMVQSGTLSHQLPGEPDLIVRVQREGVHCTTVAENVASGPSADSINNEWMHSESHRANLVDPRVNAVGIAWVEQDGRLYAVEDFAREMTALTKPQQERQVAQLLRSQAVQVEGDGSVARGYCDSGTQRSQPQPRLVMKYGTSDLSKLPPQ